MNDPIADIIAGIRAMPKYRGLDVPESTLRDIVARELAHHKRPKDGIKAARAKLHRVIAIYLGDPDYAAEALRLDALVAANADLRPWCAEVLAVHDSTRERLDLRAEFYPRIFAITGQPRVLIDVACGLNPLFFPWMGLAALTLYAYDIHAQRVAFLQHYIGRQAGLAGAALQQDILVEHPQQAGDVGLLLKEIHRFEERQRGCTRPLLEALPVRWWVLSLPTRSLTGRNDLREAHRALLARVLAGASWPIHELEFANELVWVVDKGGA